MFFFLPLITEISFYKNQVAVALYTFKALYFAFSSHQVSSSRSQSHYQTFQIKCGYPTRILQHFLTKKFNYVNLYVFIGYRICPFIIEFQNIMDWMFVESTMGISRWFMLTTIYHDLYQIKCWRVLEKQFHYPRGRPRWPSFKYSGGGFLLIMLILIMWFPLAFMSIVQTVAGVPNVPKEATISLRLNGYETLYTSTITAKSGRITPFSVEDYSALERTFSNDMGAQQYISRYEAQDIARFEYTKTSRHLWMISSNQRLDMLRYLSLIEEHKAYMTLSYSFRRKPGEYEIAEGYLEEALDDDERKSLKKHIEGIFTAFSR